MTPEQKAQIMNNAKSRVKDMEKLQKSGLINKRGDFFPSVHYPPITMYQPIKQDELFKGYTNPEDGLFDVYIHIPFCERRCVFCHYPLKLGKGQEDEKDRYLAALEKEMDIYMEQLGISQIKARSILVGGGTPTYLSHKQLKHFLDFFTKRLDMSGVTQFNYDLDPGSLIGEDGIEKMKIMRSYGVDRLTIGIQSLDDTILKKMNRTHTAAEGIESIKNALEFGFQVNIEFIFGYPGQTLEGWMEMIEEAVTLDVHEIQFYRLKIDAYGDYQGPIDSVIKKDPDRVPSNEEAIMMKQAAIDILANNGYHENTLRRVFSRKKEHYSHYAFNQCCMMYDEIGFGLATFSSLRDRFGLTCCTFEDYYAKIESGKLPLDRGLVRSQEEQYRWAIILPLKNRDIYKPAYEERTGGPVPPHLQLELEKLKKYDLIEETETHIRLTKKGKFFADEVVEHFHSPDYQPFPLDDYMLGELTPIVGDNVGANTERSIKIDDGALKK